MNEMKKEEKINRKLEKQKRRIEKKDKDWEERFGVKYSECLPKINSKTGKKEKGYFKKLSFAFKGYRARITFGFIIGFFLSAFAIFDALCWENIINGLTEGSFKVVVNFAIIYTTYMIISRILSHVYSNLINKSFHGMNYNLRIALGKNLVETKVSKFDSTSSGAVVNRVANDPVSFSNHFLDILDYTTDIIGNLVFIVYAITINVWLGLILTFIGLYTFLVENTYIKYIRKKQMKRANILADRNTSEYTEVVRGIRDVKCLNATQNLIGRANKTAKFRFVSSYHNSCVSNRMRDILSIGQSILIFGFILLGIYFVMIDAITIASLLVLMMYRGNILSFFSNLSKIKTNAQDVEIVSERMWEIIDEKTSPKEKFGEKEIENFEGKIEFKNVEFAYEEKQELFKNLNLTIKPNECVGFVGKSGQGKSTIMNLISKFYECQGGEILLDNVNIKDLSENAIRNNISVVPQSPYIFNYSIRENLLLAKPDATQEELETACKKAYIHDFIMSLDKGYDSLVGEGGVTLSGGQKQRISIARAFLKDSKILLLDEATSAVDNESQSKILQVIKDLQKQKTIIIVAHRLSTIQSCDKIFVVDNHEIIATGSHKQLMKNSEFYRNLYNVEE